MTFHAAVYHMFGQGTLHIYVYSVVWSSHMDAHFDFALLNGIVFFVLCLT